MLKAYFKLTKPGIIFGNLITAICGFFLASQGPIDIGLLLATMGGLSLIVGSACVYNNYIDRKADQKMERTKDRALAKGTISLRSALTFATVLGLLGMLLLLRFTNPLTVAVGLFGVLVYVLLYSRMKYQTPHATLVGSLAGAVPPVVGYTAVSDTFDMGAALLFTLVALWQMPHFYAIAMYRLADYRAASVPVLPAVKGMSSTKVHMTIYVILFVLASFLPHVWGYTGGKYLITAMLLGLVWLVLSLQGFRRKDDERWARQMFACSLLVIMALSILISIDTKVV